MGRLKREHREMVAAAIRRIREEYGEQAVKRWRAMQRMRGCGEAHAAQARDLLRLGSAIRIIPCPHCRTVPDLEAEFEARGPCEEVGHPEQAFRVYAGIPMVRCILCGETPTPGETMASPKLAALLQVMRCGDPVAGGDVLRGL